MAILETYPRRRACGNTRPVDQPAGEWMALVSESGVSCLGAQWILPVGRRLRIPRSVAGHDGAHPYRAGSSARAPATLREPSVPGGRRTALVAPPLGRGLAHTLLRRLSLAALGGLPLRLEHRRYRRAG